MIPYILRRLGQSVLTIFSVMVLTFILFRLNAGDIAGANLGEKARESTKAAWRHTYGYDLPELINYHEQLTVTDLTLGGNHTAASLSVEDVAPSQAADVLALIHADVDMSALRDAGISIKEGSPVRHPVLMGRYHFGLKASDPIAAITANKPVLVKVAPAETAPTTEPQADTAPAGTAASAPATTPASSATAEAEAPLAATASAPTTASAPSATAPTTTAAAPVEPESPSGPAMVFSLADGSSVVVDISGIKTVGDLIDRINHAPGADGKLRAAISQPRLSQVLDSQFFHHLWTSITFQSRSLTPGDNRKLSEIIARHAPYSLAITVPAMAWEWMLGLAVACFVAYYRQSLIDKLGVLLAVLGMCIPFLGFMIVGQWIMFQIWPEHAYGTFYRSNLYVPIAIMVVSGVGGMVRFYRTIILDETSRDYVRTAKAKGVPLPTILFKHVLRNCMLPVMTSLIMTIPFLIMGSLLVETYFGIPGLGDLLITSINNRNEPIMNGMVFLTTLVYVLGVLLTDISYAVFDPRIRLK